MKRTSTWLWTIALGIPVVAGCNRGSAAADRVADAGTKNRAALRPTAQAAPTEAAASEASNTDPSSASGDASNPTMTALLARLDARRQRRGVEYVPPTAAELGAFADWVAATEQAIRGGREPAPAPHGFEAERLPVGSAIYWLLAERREHRRGAGAVLLAADPRATPLLVEAPHTYFDAGTLPIALGIFTELNARALLINTVHRALGGDPTLDEDDEARAEVARSRRAPADLAHAHPSFYLTAHQVLTTAGALTVQLHGYRDGAAGSAHVVVSAAGSRAPTKGVAAALRELWPGDAVASYPEQVRVLGGTTNVQARESRRLGAPFLHLELSRSTRQALTADPGLLRRFARALRPALEP